MNKAVNYVLAVLAGASLGLFITSTIKHVLDIQIGERAVVDTKTRCHYLVSPYGGITPRVTPDGAIYCDSKDQ
jgi:hypothetical protein